VAQVYRFTDENGQVRLMAEIDPTPGGVFNGGTITNPLTVATAVGDASADAALVAVAPTNGTSAIAAFLDSLTTQNGLFVGLHGNVSCSSDGTAGIPSLSVSGASPGNDAFEVSSGKITLSGSTIGFFGTVPAARPTGVAVSAAGIHAALVTLGLITA
jgi:hypothetical protein